MYECHKKTDVLANMWTNVYHPDCLHLSIIIYLFVFFFFYLPELIL